MKIFKKLAVAMLTICFVSLAGYFMLQLSKSRTFQFFGHIISRVETNQKVVALTFDDAPTQYTDDVLEILKEKNVRATFYIVGQNAEKFPDIAKEIANQGNELGNHSFSHKRLVFKSQAFISSEIEMTNKLIKNAGYDNEITFRPPNGKKLFGLPWCLANHNITTVMWDVEPDTYFSGNSDLITKYTLDNTKPGSIILLHPFCDEKCDADRKALPLIIDDLEKSGYKFATVSELLKYQK